MHAGISLCSVLAVPYIVICILYAHYHSTVYKKYYFADIQIVSYSKLVAKEER